MAWYQSCDSIQIPLHPQSGYSNNIYSYEFFELVKEHLSERGTLLVFNGNNAVVTKTVLSVFDFAQVYQFCCIASNGPFSRNDARKHAVLSGFSPEERERILSCEDAYLGDRSTIVQALKGYPVNRDWKPVAEYFLGIELTKGSALDIAVRND